MFLFGAGASRYSGACVPHPPPLGADLFDELVLQGGVAAEITPDVAAVFRSNFEEGMAAFRAAREASVPAFLRRMAKYFARFKPGPSNLYVELLRGLCEKKRPFQIATLNYDLLIEHSLHDLGLVPVYEGPVKRNESVLLIKVHGSCNFLPALNFKIRNVEFVGYSAAKSLVDTRQIDVVDPVGVEEFCDRENSIAPVMALYARGKQVLFGSSVAQGLQDQYADAVRRAARVYVIGVAVNEHDGHVWGPLAASQGKLFCVDPQPGPFLAWAKRNHRRHARHLASTFEESIPMILRHHAGLA